MSDINVAVITGMIDSAIDYCIGRNATPVVQFYLRGSFGRIKCVTCGDLATAIQGKYRRGEKIVVSGSLRHDKWMKSNGEWDRHWEFYIRQEGEINVMFLTGGIKSEPVSAESKTGRIWTKFKLACGAQAQGDSLGLKGDPVIIETWTERKAFGDFLRRHFRLGTQLTTTGRLSISEKDGQARMFLSAVDVWWRGLHAINKTTEPESEKEQERRLKPF